MKRILNILTEHNWSDFIPCHDSCIFENGKRIEIRYPIWYSRAYCKHCGEWCDEYGKFVSNPIYLSRCNKRNISKILNIIGF